MNSGRTKVTGRTVKERSRRAAKSDSGERTLLDAIRRRTAGPASGVRLGIGDDCALLRVGANEEIAVTTDLSVDGRHFRLAWHPAEAVGHRTLARGLSDLAAMGARPVAAFLSLGLPRELAVRHGRGAPWVERFYDGLLALADRHRTPLAGGDLGEAPVAVADIVLVGAVPRGQALLRSKARPGDRIYVTGTLGGAAAGLRRLGEEGGLLRKKAGRELEEALRPHLYPQPRLKQGQWLRKHGAARAAIDVSDGVSTDLGHLCEESAVAAEIEADWLPIAPGATLDDALDGGEDYELLFTASASARVPAKIAGVPVTPIGRILPRRAGRPQVVLIEAGKRHPLAPHGWEHFRKVSDGLDEHHSGYPRSRGWDLGKHAPFPGTFR